MSELNRKHGAREAPNQSAWGKYKLWLGGLDRGQKIRYRLLQAAAVLSLLVIVGYAALSAWIRVPEVPADTRGEQNELSGDASLPKLPTKTQSSANGRKDGVYTFLVAGRDVVSGSTDTMLLVSYDTGKKTVFGLNLPRDTMVNVSTSSKRLNAVYTYNRGKDKAAQTEKGMAALKEEVSKLTGIAPDFYVVVEWEAVGRLVDALEGVEFEVPFNMDYDDPEQDLHIHQKAGLRLLDGDDAMQVIRHRKNNDGSHSNGDVGRLEVQQSFLKAVAKKCLQPATLLKIPSLAQIFLDNVKTDLTLGNIIAFAQLAKGMDAESGVDFQTAPLAASFTYNGASLVTLDGEEMVKLVNEKMNPYTRQIKLSDLELLYRNANGSFGVTSGTLADAGFSRPYVPQSKPKPEEPDEPDVPPEDTDPDGETPQPGAGTAQPGTGTEPGGGTSQPGTGTEPGGETTPGGGTTAPGEGEPGTGQPGGEGPQPGEPGTGEEPLPGTGDPLGTIDPGDIFPDPTVQNPAGEPVQPPAQQPEDGQAGYDPNLDLFPE